MTAIEVGTVERSEGFERWRRIALGTLKLFFDPDTAPRCAGTAFFGFLSLFPAIATIFLIYGLVADTRLLVETIGNLQYLLPKMALDLLGEQLVMLANQSNTTLGLGLLISIPLALWSGSRGIDALLYAMSRVRGEPPRRGFVKTVLYAIGLTVAGAIFLVVSLVTVAGLPALIPIPTGEEWLLLVLRWPVLLVITVAILGALYRWGPDRHPREFRYIWPGAVLASILWILAGAVFSIYVENFGNFEASFGSVSAAVVLLLWMYNSAQIFVLGAAFNAELQREMEPEAIAERPVPERIAGHAGEHEPASLQGLSAVNLHVSTPRKIRRAVHENRQWFGALLGFTVAATAALVSRALEHREDDEAA
jgi:membrane protein